jgi:hypothetical protein
MKKQTAVDLLVSILNKDGFTPVLTDEEIQQAKQMEKEQIEEAWDDGQECEYQYHINSEPKYNSETFYNETYGGQDE